MTKEKDLGHQILEYLYLHPHTWFNDEKLSERFNAHSKETIEQHLNHLTHDKLVHTKEYFTSENPITFLHHTYRISGEGKNKIEDDRYIRKLRRNAFIGIALAIATGLIIFFFKYYEPLNSPKSIESVPAILEDSLSNETNTLIDTVSGRSAKDSNESEKKGKDDL